jgi:transposase
MSCMEQTLTLNSQNQKRIKILNQLLAGEISVGQAAELAQRSVRQIYRLKASYREKGAAAVIHGNCGKRSPQRLPDETREQVCALAQEKYAGCNQHHLRDLLEEKEGLTISRASVRRILQEKGLLVVQHAKKPRQHRLRRARYRQEGQLLQVDASPHAWLQERGPRLSLVGGIDDATGKVVGAVFREQEDQQGYMQMLRQVVEHYGSPQAIYHDRHTMFPQGKYHVDEKGSLEEQLEGKRHDTQLGRLFEHLHITSIAARSPQAKGRIERLWGTFQDRLVSELRLAGARTLEQANTVLQDYLPRFNARFAVPAADLTLGWQAKPATLVLDECFCLQNKRTVTLDHTVSYQGQRLQLLPTADRPSLVRATVCIHEHFDGSLAVFHQGQAVPSRLAPPDPAQVRAAAQTVSAARPPEVPTAEVSPPTKPKANHPWRRKAVTS